MAADRYDVDVVNELKRHGKYKGFCMILNGALACLYCILSGYVAVGIVLGVLIIGVGAVYYVLQSLYPAMDFSRPGTNYYGTTTEAPISVVPMIVSWPVALFASLIAAQAGGQLKELWIWIAASFAFTLFLQCFMWKENWSWAVDHARERQKAEAFQEGLKNFMERVEHGEVGCAMCGGRIWDKYSIAFKDQGVIILCPDCMPWKMSGSTEMQGMTFFHRRL